MCAFLILPIITHTYEKSTHISDMLLNVLSKEINEHNLVGLLFYAFLILNLSVRNEQDSVTDNKSQIFSPKCYFKNLKKVLQKVYSNWRLLMHLN